MRVLALLLATLVLAGCAEPQASPESTGADGKGPSWSFTAIDGETYTRDEPAGNATVLFFMATWCGTCRARAPVIAEVAEDHAESGVRVFSIGFDPSETADDLRGWQERYRQHWPHGTDPSLSIQRTFSIRAQSSVVVLDADGNLVERFGYGEVTEDGLRDAVTRALAA